jgi:hypothetical protein
VELRGMTSQTTLQLPQSVVQYLTEPKLRAGVDSVLEYGARKLPPGLEWDELPQYFRAALAANHVQVDWALAHEELWRCVWPSELVGWSPASLDEQSTRDFDAHVSIDNSWSDEWLWRCFTRPASRTTSAKPRRQPAPDKLYLGVSITLQGASVGVSIDPSPTATAPDPTLFHFDEEFTAWRSEEQSIEGPTLDLSELQHAARRALNWVSESSRSDE